MNILRLLLFLSVWFGVAASQSAQLDTSLALLSPCALECFFTAIQASQCSLSNTTCICTDEPLHRSAETCLLSSCTLKESLSAKNVTASSCGMPIHDASGRARATYISLAVLGMFFASVRILYKLFHTTTRLTADDYMLLISALHGLPSLFVMDMGARHNGSGRDIWTVPFDAITRFLHWIYIMELLYISQISFIKLTMLLFFLRIFPRKTVQVLFKCTAVFTVLYGLAFTLTAIFQCRPIAYFWYGWDGEHSGRCISVNGLVWVHAGINILLDAWMLAIPLHQVFQLDLSRQKKLSIALMFCVGTFVTVVSIIRLHSLVHFASTKNPTWDQTNIIIWSSIEINVALLCICMPTMRVMLARLFPHVRDSLQRSVALSQGPRTFTHSGDPGRSGLDEGKTVSSLGKSAQEVECTRVGTEEVELVRTDVEEGKSLGCESTRTSKASV